MSVAEAIPSEIYRLPLGERVTWARKRARLSHDRLIERLGRSNRSHLIKIEKGDHVPRDDLRNALADALNVPRELFADDPQEAAPSGGTFRGRARADAGSGDGAARRAGAREAARPAVAEDAA